MQAYIELSGQAIRRLVDLKKCPVSGCEGVLRPWGFYRRRVRTASNVIKILVARCRCTKCGGTQQFLPPFVARYGRWSLDTLLGIFERLSLSADTLSSAWITEGADAMDLSTCYRWRARVVEWFEKANGHLQSYVARIAGDLDMQQRLESEPRGASGWGKARRWFLTLQAVNEVRRHGQPPASPLSVGGVVYFLAHETWQRLVT